MHLVVTDLQAGYLEVCETVLCHGEEVSPRGQLTRECRDVSIELLDPRRSLPLGMGRKVNTKIAAVEALQLIGGVCDPAAMLRASAGFREFMDGGTFHGGYGQRTRAQFPAVIERLRLDPDTRQAIVTIWDPLHDLFVEGVHDYPCTLSLQFLVRGGKLEMHTHMRSNDAWRGLAYDVFVFTQVQLAVAAARSLDVGAYHHHVTSLHIYDRDRAACEAMLACDHAFKPESFDSLIKPSWSWGTASHVARTLLAAPGVHNFGDCANEEMITWYTARLK